MLDLLEAPSTYGEAVRRCSRCGETRPLAEFPVKKKTTGLRRVWCRTCCRAYGREHYQRNKPVYLNKASRRNALVRKSGREQLIEYLRAHPCVGCGQTEITLLDFDHRDRSSSEARSRDSCTWWAGMAP